MSTLSHETNAHNPGAKHENGSIESPHGHIKRRIKQALLLKGSCDFISVESYQDFINLVVNQHNRRNAKALIVETRQTSIFTAAQDNRLYRSLCCC